MKNKYLLLTVLLMQATSVWAMDSDDELKFSYEDGSPPRFSLPYPAEDPTSIKENPPSQDSNPMRRIKVRGDESKENDPFFDGIEPQHPTKEKRTKEKEEITKSDLPTLSKKVIEYPVPHKDLRDLALGCDKIRLGELVLFSEGKKLYCKSDNKAPIEIIRSDNPTKGLYFKSFDRIVSAINSEIKVERFHVALCQEEERNHELTAHSYTEAFKIIKESDIQGLLHYTSMIGYTSSEGKISQSEKFTNKFSQGNSYDTLPIKRSPNFRSEGVKKEEDFFLTSSLPKFLDQNEYKKVATLNELCGLTHGLSSDVQNTPEKALMALFGKNSGKIEGLWKTASHAWDTYPAKDNGVSALYNRMARYDATQNKRDIIKMHIDLVKAITEQLFFLKNRTIISEITNMEIKHNIKLFAGHMKSLYYAKSYPQRAIQDLHIEALLANYRKWLGNPTDKTSKIGSLLEAYSGIWDWEVIQPDEHLRN